MLGELIADAGLFNADMRGDEDVHVTGVVYDELSPGVRPGDFFDRLRFCRRLVSASTL